MWWEIHKFSGKFLINFSDSGVRVSYVHAWDSSHHINVFPTGVINEELFVSISGYDWHFVIMSVEREAVLVLDVSDFLKRFACVGPGREGGEWGDYPRDGLSGHHNLKTASLQENKNNRVADMGILIKLNSNNIVTLIYLPTTKYPNIFKLPYSSTSGYFLWYFIWSCIKLIPFYC